MTDLRLCAFGGAVGRRSQPSQPTERPILVIDRANSCTFVREAHDILQMVRFVVPHFCLARDARYWHSAGVGFRPGSGGYRPWLNKAGASSLETFKGGHGVLDAEHW
jgi:hypothetical protein